MFPTVFRPAIKASTLFGDIYRQLLKADTEMRLWKYEIDTIVVTKHNRRLLWRGKCFEYRISLWKLCPKTGSNIVELVDIKQQTQTCALYSASVMSKQKRGKVRTPLLKFETPHKCDSFYLQFLRRTFAYFCILGRRRRVIQIKSWQYIQANGTFLLHKIKCRYQSHVLLAVLGIDQSQSQAASLSTGRSAEDDTFSDRVLSMTVLEWNPQPCLLTAKAISIILFLTNSSHPSLNLIGLWGSCKTKAANLSECVWTVACHWILLESLSLCSAKFEKHDSHILGALMSHSLSGLKVHSIWGLVYFDVGSLVMRF